MVVTLDEIDGEFLTSRSGFTVHERRLKRLSNASTITKMKRSRNPIDLQHDRMRLTFLTRCGIAQTIALCGFALVLPAHAGNDVDTFIEQRLADEGVTPAPIAEDAEFLRRVTLDLAGRIPIAEETRAFLADGSTEKRTALVDRLLSEPDFAFHLRNEIDLLLLARIKNDDDWRAYLLQATQEGRAWDQVFREVILPERERPDERGPAAFLRERIKELDDLTNDTASLFFGVNVSCAKCHDHPLVADWEQRHYFGMASFFRRSYQTKKGQLAERFDGDVKFTDVAGEEHQAAFMFLTGATVEEPELGLSDEERKRVQDAIRVAEKEDDAEPPPLPEFSPRTEFVRLALEDGERFSRNIVNRTWARLTGRGLVHPLDQMHSENLPSHPELLDHLAQGLVEAGYDLKPLIREIVLSDTYARTSQWPVDAELPAPELFARAVARPLTPRQFALSLQIAATNPDQLPGPVKPEDWSTKREELEKRSNGLAQTLEIPGDNFQVSVDEALLFSNGERITNEYLRDGSGDLVGYLKALDDNGALIDSAFMSVLSREPVDVEREAYAAYLADRSDRRVDAIRQVVWTLLTSPEFRFNH